MRTSYVAELFEHLRTTKATWPHSLSHCYSINTNLDLQPTYMCFCSQAPLTCAEPVLCATGTQADWCSEEKRKWFLKAFM